MNKSETIDMIAAEAGITKAQAKTAFEALIGSLETSLKKEGSASIVGFGTFTVTKRAARTGRNPQTGEALKIKASKSVRFKAGKALKDAVQKAKV